MKVQLPPALFYAIGLMLVVFGALRAYYMGWQRRNSDIVDEGRGGTRPRNHILWGTIWVALGLFLLISTFINSRR